MKGNTNQLSANAIYDLFDLNATEKKTYEVEMNLQILNIKICDSTSHQKGGNSEMFTATLSDSKFKYNGFIIFKVTDSEPLKDGDVIKVITVTPANLKSQKSRVFIVKKYELISKGGEVIGDPELIKDEGDIARAKDKVNQIKSECEDDNFMHDLDEAPSRTKRSDDKISKINKIMNFMADDDLDINTPVKNPRNKFYTPLKQLTTFSKDFRIYVRVIKKSDLKTFNSSPNKNGGTLFSFVILDEEGNEMQVTCFNKAVQKFYNVIHENKVFEISGGYVKINDKKFSSVKSDYKIVIDENSKVMEIQDDGSIQHQKFMFTKIADLVNAPLYSVVDCIGYVLEVGEKIIKNTKNGEQPMKKVIIADTSDCKIEFTLWRVFAHKEVNVGEVIALKNVKIGEFNGRNISTFEESGVITNPMIREATEVRYYIENHKKLDTLKNLSVPAVSQKESNENNFLPTVFYMKDVLDLLDDVIADDKLPMSRIKATVTQMMHNDKNFYGGCEDQRCKKKLQQETYNWVCLSCNKSYPKPTYYYTLSIRVKDCSSEHWIDIFGSVAEKLMKITAEEYKELLNDRDENKLRQISSNIEFKTFFFYVKPKLHFYNSIPKKKLYAYKVEAIDCTAEIKRMTKALATQLKL